MRQVITYLDTATLIERGSGIVRFGTAPDGLPFLVTVPAPPRADDLLRQVAWAMGVVAPEPRYDGTPLEPLVRDLNRILREQLIQRLATDEGGQIEVMILPLAVRSLVGATLLDRLFNPPHLPRTVVDAHVAPITAVNFAAASAPPGRPGHSVKQSPPQVKSLTRAAPSHECASLRQPSAPRSAPRARRQSARRAQRQPGPTPAVPPTLAAASRPRNVRRRAILHRSSRRVKRRASSRTR